MEIQLIQLYLLVCHIYDIQSETCFQRLSTNSKSTPGSHITIFDALTDAGNQDNLEGLDEKRQRFVCGDTTDREAVLTALDEETDAIVNFAAESRVDRRHCFG